MSEAKMYEIRLEGHVESNWSSWFYGMIIRRETSGETVLRGMLADQAALHGVLTRIRDLGLPLLELKGIQNGDTISSESATGGTKL